LVKTFEVSTDSPYLSPLSDFKADSLHQALSFTPKAFLDVRNVEFCRAYRLTINNIEPVSFRLPRIRKEYFQDDVYNKETRVTWEAALSAADWFSGQDAGSLKTVTLKPDDMINLSEAGLETVKTQKYENFYEYKAKYKTDEQKKDELISAMTNKLCLNDGPLKQDLMEGVDPDEWDD
jgi:coronin-7